MQNHLPTPPPQRSLTSPAAENLAEQVKTELRKRGSAPSESEVMRLVKALTRLQPAALSALANSPSADPADAFSSTLQSLVV